MIYEPFSQTGEEPVSLGGLSGGVGLDTWSIDQTVNVEQTPTLPYGDLQNAGGQAEMLDGNGVDAWVTTTSVPGDDNLLDDGATLWFGYMFQKTSGGGSNEWAGFAFGTERLNAAYNGPRMENSGNGVGVTTRDKAVTVGVWSGGGRVDQGGSISLGGSLDPYPVGALVDGKIEWCATAPDDETITIYAVDPADPATLGGGVTKTVTGFDQTVLDTISFTQRNSGGTNDSVLTTDGSGDGKVRVTLTGSPRDFVRAESTP